jgi:hypothetical protein
MNVFSFCKGKNGKLIVHWFLKRTKVLEQK